MSLRARTSAYMSSQDCTRSPPTTRRTSCSSTASTDAAICSHRNSTGGPAMAMYPNAAGAVRSWCERIPFT
eukprot:scaffold30415_cov124-Isochrysis_galbana.AAC.6